MSAYIVKIDLSKAILTPNQFPSEYFGDDNSGIHIDADSADHAIAQVASNTGTSQAILIAYPQTGAMTMFTRQQYLNNECTHRQYYAQFVTSHTREMVRIHIGLEALRASTDEDLNDIKLSKWNTIPHAVKLGSMKAAGDYLTPAGWVCIAKEAAQQLLEKTNPVT